jgi:hypothetical protein
LMESGAYSIFGCGSIPQIGLSVTANLSVFASKQNVRLGDR